MGDATSQRLESIDINRRMGSPPPWGWMAMRATAPGGTESTWRLLNSSGDRSTALNKEESTWASTGSPGASLSANTRRWPFTSTSATRARRVSPRVGTKVSSTWGFSSALRTRGSSCSSGKLRAPRLWMSDTNCSTRFWAAGISTGRTSSHGLSVGSRSRGERGGGGFEGVGVIGRFHLDADQRALLHGEHPRIPPPVGVLEERQAERAMGLVHARVALALDVEGAIEVVVRAHVEGERVLARGILGATALGVRYIGPGHHGGAGWFQAVAHQVGVGGFLLQGVLELRLDERSCQRVHQEPVRGAGSRGGGGPAFLPPLP